MNINTAYYKSIAKAGNLFLPVFTSTPLEKEDFFSYLPDTAKDTLVRFAKECKRGEGEVKTLRLFEDGIKSIVLFGMGAKEKWNARKHVFIARRMVQYAKGESIKEFSVPIPLIRFEKKSLSETAKVFAENAILGNFAFTKYKEMPKEGWPEVHAVNLLVEGGKTAEVLLGIREGAIIGEETNECRALANTPGGDMTPVLLAEAARRSVAKLDVRVNVFDEKKMASLGMGAILGVAKGSVEKPRFIILEYLNGPKNQKPLVLAGKGVTFDTGGLNLKPSNYIYEMHMDMSGGAAVIHGIAAIARLKLPLNAIGLIPAAENMPSGSSYHPGDLLKSLSGKTIEVLDTDAEGRVLLSDALTYGLRYKPGLLIDFATLTGAAHVALGSHMSAVFTREHDQKLQDTLIEVGLQSGDYVWPLPLWDEYLTEIKGTFGDLANVGSRDRYGGAIHGAKFLEQFAGDARFAHIDIAPRMTTIEGEYLAKGASGVGVRFIVELAKSYSRIMSHES
ncbi:MAG: leucyl aminopeptidase family protein [Candidatus Sungbacteria bacterium]|nr:leucyl aminopeptidase family protein [Candidatus Sungbacteria bacterium]